MIESSRFQKGSLMLQKNKTTDDTWVLRFYEEVQGKRVYRKRRIGTVRQYPHRRDAEKAVLSIRANINSGVRSPETVRDLATHYERLELTPKHKAFATRETHKGITKNYVLPLWGERKLCDVRTVDVEKWLDAVQKSPATKTKIKSCFSVLYSHAIRHEWLTFNPISKVRTSSKPLREKDTLSPQEFRALLTELSVRERAMVLLAGSTAMRRSELIALTWKDLNVDTLEVSITKTCYRNQFGDTKTQASRRPVPLHPIVLAVLLDWKKEALFTGESDFIFASTRLNGKKPLSPDSLLKKSIRPALERANIHGKIVGFHTFRHSVATQLRSLGVDVKVAQELLRHANSRITLDIYTHAVSDQKRDASNKLLDLLLPATP